jgi:hypothetical protein
LHATLKEMAQASFLSNKYLTSNLNRLRLQALHVTFTG